MTGRPSPSRALLSTMAERDGDDPAPGGADWSTYHGNSRASSSASEFPATGPRRLAGRATMSG